VSEQVKQPRILIADDDPRVLLILRTALERMKKGYRIVAVQDGTEAMQKIEAQPFDLVITDMKMRGADGLELVEAIRTMDQSTAVIMITAHGCHRLQKACDRLSVYRCLDKPLRIGEIRRAALEALGIITGPEKTDG
jgi:DNA-binding NtrC family response regulator